MKVTNWTTFRGITIPLHTLGHFSDVHPQTFKYRILNDWNIEVALLTPAQVFIKGDARWKCDNFSNAQKKKLDKIERKCARWAKANASSIPEQFPVNQPIIKTQAEKYPNMVELYVNDVRTDLTALEDKVQNIVNFLDRIGYK